MHLPQIWHIYKELRFSLCIQADENRLFFCNFFIRQQCIDGIFFCIELDEVSVLYKTDQSSFKCFRCDVSYNKTMGSSGESSVCDQCYIFPKPEPIKAEVGFSISGIPGAPFGPSFLMTTTFPSLIFLYSIPLMNSFSPSNTIAVPLK